MKGTTSHFCKRCKKWTLHYISHVMRGLVKVQRYTCSVCHTEANGQ